MITCVLFDLFGTLIKLKRDSRPYHQLISQLSAANRTEQLKKCLIHPCETLTEFCHLIGLPPPNNIDLIEAELKQDLESAVLFDDSLATLVKLQKRGIKLGLISNLATPYKLPVQALKLEKYFDAITFSCDEAVAKPDARIYEIALNRLNEPASQTLMIGDNYKSDIVGAFNAGIAGALLDRVNLQSSNCKVIFELSEVLDAI